MKKTEWKQIALTIVAGASASIVGALVIDYIRDKKEKKKEEQDG